MMDPGHSLDPDYALEDLRTEQEGFSRVRCGNTWPTQDRRSTNAAF